MHYPTFFLLPALIGATVLVGAGESRAQEESPMRVIIYNSGPAARPSAAPRQTYRPRQRYSDKPKLPTMIPVPEFLADGSPNPEYTPGAMMPAPTPSAATPPPAGTQPVIPLAQRTGIVLVGDSLADALAAGLEADETFKAEFALRTRTVSASGLVRDDFHDWPRTIETMLRETPRPAAIVIMLGLNDRQLLKAGGESLPPLTPAWRDAYAKRIEMVISATKTTGVPLIWVGLPTMRLPALSSDLAQINTMIRERVTAAGETFIETYDGFADASGGFTATGPDIIGDTVRLRGPDGIHFTPAGQRKLAFFVDKPLRKRLEPTLRPAPAMPAPAEKRDGEVSVPLPAPKAAATPQIPARIRPEIGEARPLGTTPTASALAGTAPPHQDPAAEAFFGQGISPPPRAGRADDHRWK